MADDAKDTAKDTAKTDMPAKTDAPVKVQDPTDGTGPGSTPPGMRGLEGVTYPTHIDPTTDQAGPAVDPLTGVELTDADADPIDEGDTDTEKAKLADKKAASKS